MVFLVLCGLAWAGPSSADEVGGSSGDSLAVRLLEALCESGDIDPARCEELRAAVADRAVPVPTADVEVAEGEAIEKEEPDPTWEFHWKDGIKLQRSDGYHKFQFLGRIQLDWAGISNSDSLTAQGFDDGFGVEFRRARLGISGTLFKYIVFKNEYDFAESAAEFKDVYVGLKFPKVEALVGHMKEPFSLDQMASSRHLTFVERSLIDDFSPQRNTGFRFMTRQLDQRLTAAGGFFVVADDFGRGFTDRPNYNITTRITGIPLYEDDGEKLVHLGLGYSHGFRHPRAERVLYEIRPEIHLADKIFTNDLTGTGIDASHEDLVGLEFAAVYRSWSVQSEFIYNHVTGRGATPSRDYKGAYVELSYFITGEHRRYKKSAGAFGRTRPIKNFDPFQGHWGAFQIAFRYSHLDLRSKQNGNVGNNFTAGINWNLFSHLRVAANYVYADQDQPGPDGHMNGFVSRFYVDW